MNSLDMKVRIDETPVFLDEEYSICRYSKCSREVTLLACLNHVNVMRQEAARWAREADKLEAFVQIYVDIGVKEG